MVSVKRFRLAFIIMAAVFLSSNAFCSGDEIIAYYFHGNFRCASCLNIEKYTKAALEESFGNELESGILSYQIINTEEKGNEHFIQDYQLYTKSVVLSLVKDGKEVKFKNLQKVWEYLRNKDKFTEYIKSETQNFLKELEGDNL